MYYFYSYISDFITILNDCFINKLAYFSYLNLFDINLYYAYLCLYIDLLIKNFFTFFLTKKESLNGKN